MLWPLELRISRGFAPDPRGRSAGTRRGPVKKKFESLGVEAPGWPGARREHTGSIRLTGNAARWDGSAVKNVK